MTDLASRIREQVEYYLGDTNLETDKFFRDQISSAKDGWIDVQLL
jgi:hypothetical protein